MRDRVTAAHRLLRTDGCELVPFLQLQLLGHGPDQNEIAALQHDTVGMALAVVIQMLDCALRLPLLFLAGPGNLYFFSIGPAQRDEIVHRMIRLVPHREADDRHGVAGMNRLLNIGGSGRRKIHLDHLARIILQQNALRFAARAEIESLNRSTDRLRGRSRPRGPCLRSV